MYDYYVDVKTKEKGRNEFGRIMGFYKILTCTFLK
jgi:hypothetical protein